MKAGLRDETESRREKAGDGKRVEESVRTRNTLDEMLIAVLFLLGGAPVLIVLILVSVLFPLLFPLLPLSLVSSGCWRIVIVGSCSSSVKRRDVWPDVFIIRREEVEAREKVLCAC